jgi:hypothetical protein
VVEPLPLLAVVVVVDLVRLLLQAVLAAEPAWLALLSDPTEAMSPSMALSVILLDRQSDRDPASAVLLPALVLVDLPQASGLLRVLPVGVAAAELQARWTVKKAVAADLVRLAELVESVQAQEPLTELP